MEPVDEPDEVKVLPIDRKDLPEGHYQPDGYEIRQVIDVDISRFVTEYQAEVLRDEKGNRFVAAFPDGVKAAVQYGTGVKVNAVYQSQFQLIPYKSG